MFKHRWLFVLSLLVAAAFLLLPGAVHTGKHGDVEQAKDLKVTIADLEKKYAKLNSRTERLQEQVSWLSRTSPPVGTVLAFAGEWPPQKGEGGKWTEEELGWKLCDGRQMSGPEYAELRAVLGKDNLPDHRGCFLRGIDRDMNGKSSGRDKDGIRSIGGVQGYATALPVSKNFVTNEAGKHNHHNEGFSLITTPDDGKLPRFPANTRKSVGTAALTDFKPMKDNGDHRHNIESGGDAETRPINIAVH